MLKSVDASRSEDASITACLLLVIKEEHLMICQSHSIIIYEIRQGSFHGQSTQMQTQVMLGELRANE